MPTTAAASVQPVKTAIVARGDARAEQQSGRERAERDGEHAQRARDRHHAPDEPVGRQRVPVRRDGGVGVREAEGLHGECDREHVDVRPDEERRRRRRLPRTPRAGSCAARRSGGAAATRRDPSSVVAPTRATNAPIDALDSPCRFASTMTASCTPVVEKLLAAIISIVVRRKGTCDRKRQAFRELLPQRRGVARALLLEARAHQEERHGREDVRERVDEERQPRGRRRRARRRRAARRDAPLRRAPARRWRRPAAVRAARPPGTRRSGRRGRRRPPVASTNATTRIAQNEAWCVSTSAASVPTDAALTTSADDHQAPAVEAVGGDTGREVEQEQRRELRGADEARLRRRAGHARGRAADTRASRRSTRTSRAAAPTGAA